MRIPTFEQLEQPPDFERRCDAFVQAANALIKEKYPHFNFVDIENRTKDLLENPGLKTIAPDNEILQAWQNEADKSSAYFNQARVSVSQYSSGTVTKQDLLPVAHDLEELARKHGGTKEWEELEIIQDEEEASGLTVSAQLDQSFIFS